MKKHIFLLLFTFTTFLQAQDNLLPFQNPSLSLEERMEDLISRMTLEEKVAQLKYDAPAIEHLNVPAYNWWK